MIGPDPDKNYTFLNETFRPYGKPSQNSKKFEKERNHKYNLSETNNEKYYYGPHLYL